MRLYHLPKCLNNIRRCIGVRTLKTGIGATVAIMIAQGLGLDWSASAGIVAILSIQNTKRESVRMAVNRFYAAVLGLLFATLLFEGIAFHPVVFGLYLIGFIPLAVKCKIQEGIVPTAVLVTHLLASNNVTVALLINELLLIGIGAGVALILNLYIPSSEKELREVRHQAEDEMHQLFCMMREALLNNANGIADEKLIVTIGNTLEKGRREAYKQANNHYFFNARILYEDYFEMRLKQFQVLCYMQEHFRRFFMQYQETKEVADFMEDVAESVHGKQSAYVLLNDLEGLRQHFKQSALPSTREEFENRAMLYQFLNDLEHFLEIKRDFREKLTEEEREEYERGYKK